MLAQTMVSENKGKINQFFRFCLVGLMNCSVDFIVFFTLISGGISHLLAQGLSYSAGVVNRDRKSVV